MPCAIGVAVIRRAKAFAELPTAKLKGGVERHVGNIRELMGYLWRVTQAGEVTRGDAEHFALLELAEFAEGLRVIPGVERWLQESVNFAAQAFRPARVG
jgi:hypothetical protein